MTQANFVLYESQCSNNCTFCGGRALGNIQGNIQAEFGKLEKILARDIDIHEIELSGNDPLEYDGLHNLVSELKRRFPQAALLLSTHGRRLAEGNRLGELIAAGIEKFIIPLYGASKDVHESVTRASESFVETVAALAKLKESRAHFQVTSLVTKQNESTLSALVAFVSDFSDNLTIGVPHLTDPRANPDSFTPDKLGDNLLRAIATSISLGKPQVFLRNIPPCILGFDYPLIEISSPPEGGYLHLRNSRAGHPSKRPVVETPDATLPLDRVRSKVDQCEKCVANARCPGFYATYLNSGLFNPAPLQ